MKRTDRIELRIAPDQLDRWREVARRQGRSVASLIRDATDAYIELRDVVHRRIGGES